MWLHVSVFSRTSSGQYFPVECKIGEHYTLWDPILSNAVCSVHRIFHLSVYNCGRASFHVEQKVQMYNGMSRGKGQASVQSFNVREMLFPCPLCSEVSEAERTLRKTFPEMCTRYSQDNISS